MIGQTFCSGQTNDSLGSLTVMPDTNVAMSSCAYDRIVVAGDNLQHKIINGSVGVFRFDRVYNLSTDQTNLVSDHYPVELQLISQPPTEAQPPDGSLTSVEVHPLNGSQFPTQSSPTEVQPPDDSQAPVEVHPSNGSNLSSYDEILGSLGACRCVVSHPRSNDVPSVSLSSHDEIIRLSSCIEILESVGACRYIVSHSRMTCRLYEIKCYPI